MIINTRELMEKTGATHRQIDYWCSEGIIPALYGGNPNSGTPRAFSEDIVNPVRLLVHVSRLKRDLMLKDVYENYQLGYLEVDGITVSWDVVAIEREGQVDGRTPGEIR